MGSHDTDEYSLVNWGIMENIQPSQLELAFLFPYPFKPQSGTGRCHQSGLKSYFLFFHICITVTSVNLI